MRRDLCQPLSTREDPLSCMTRQWERGWWAKVAPQKPLAPVPVPHQTGLNLPLIRPSSVEEPLLVFKPTKREVFVVNPEMDLVLFVRCLLNESTESPLVLTRFARRRWNISELSVSGIIQLHQLQQPPNCVFNQKC